VAAAAAAAAVGSLDHCDVDSLDVGRSTLDHHLGNTNPSLEGGGRSRLHTDRLEGGPTWWIVVKRLLRI